MRSRLLYYCFVALVALSFGAAGLYAQAPRVSLIEEFTNASCGPCASQNPTFEHFLAQPVHNSELIPIVWHVNWPGGDVMNAANPDVYQNRVSLYGIQGVPSAVVNGLVEVPPADTAQLMEKVLEVAGVSPISINIAMTENGSQVSGEVVVHTTDALSNAVLQIVVTEGYHYYASAGSNGEKEFFYIARDMLPNVDGTELSMAADETKNIPFSFEKDAEWNPSEIYIVAYVQSTSNKEVLQANSNRVYLSVPTGETVYEKLENAPRTFGGSFSIPMTGTYKIGAVSELPAEWNGTISIDGTPVTGEQEFQFTEGATVSFSATIAPATGLRRDGNLVFNVSGPRGASGRATYRYINSPIQILMSMHDGGNATTIAAYDAALKAANTWSYAFAVMDENAMFNPAEHLINTHVFGGYFSFTEEFMNSIAAQVAAGGKLWFTGGDLGWGLTDPDALQYDPNCYQDDMFLKNVLHAEYVADVPAQATTHAVRGFANDPIADGLQFTVRGYPDVIKTYNGSEAAFYYGTTQANIAGVRFANESVRFVYYPFAVETITSKPVLNNLTKKTIEWLLGLTDVTPVQTAADGFGLGMYPNPASGAAQVPVVVPNAQQVTIALYNIYGQKVATVFEGQVAAGASQYALNTADLPAGTYTLKLQAGSHVTTKMISVVK